MPIIIYTVNILLLIFFYLDLHIMCNVFLDGYLNMMNINDMLNTEAPSDNTSGGNSPGPEGNNSGGNNPGHPGNNSGNSNDFNQDNNNSTPDVLTNKLANQLDNHSRGLNKRLSMSSQNWDRDSRLDTPELRLELVNRVNSSDSLNGKFYVRTKTTDGQSIVCRLGNNRETSITHDILDAVRKTRSNQTENVMQPRPSYRYNEMYPRPDNTENVNFPGPNEPINYIRRIPKE
jgi:hypothetical protein